MQKVFWLLTFVVYIYNVKGEVIKRAACVAPTSNGGGSCACVDDVVKCNNLIRIPDFGTSNYYKEVDLSGNNLGSHINNSTIININTTVLNLYDGNINQLGYRMFDRLTNLKSLNLSHNSLTELPRALSTFKNLESLDVSYNGITDADFTEDVMRNLGRSLRKFSFGSKDILNWPTTLKHLQMLEELIVSEARIRFLPENAFYGFDRSLKKLTIQNTMLRSVPTAIARLPFLEVLNFDHNKLVKDEGMNVPVGTGILFNFLTNISIQDDGLSTFPRILQAFQYLSSLKIGNQNLKFVSDNAAEAVRQIKHLSMRNANITRIPDALQDILALETVDLSDNHIHSIDQPDIQDLEKLQTLRLNENPILYVSDNALDSNDQLRTIELRNTSLLQVPCALENFLESLKKSGQHNKNITVDLRGDDIECTCGLRWLYEVIEDVKDIDLTVLGRCETIEMDIQDYITQQLSLCPVSGPCSRD